MQRSGPDRLTRLRQSVAYFPTRATLRAISRGARLPPGALYAAQDEIRRDQLFFLRRARELGPVFKINESGHYTTCVVGHERGGHLVSEYNDRLSAVTVDLTGLFPNGSMRQMTGEAHRHYRRIFLGALQATPLSAHAAEIGATMRFHLRDLAQGAAPLAAEALREGLRRLTTEIMLRLLFGVRSGSPEFSELEADYRRFGPQEPVYEIRDEQVATFARITTCLQRIARTPDGPPNLLRHMVQSGDLDETTMGSLAYLFEPSHFDVYCLWHWVLKFLGTSPQVQASYRAIGDAPGRGKYAEAIVSETLRLAQSEVLWRRVNADLVFEGFLLPRDTRLRVCIWEGHKDGDAFPEPFTFDPGRFVAGKPGLDTYAPFGIGPRHCLGASLVLGLSALFVQAVLDTHDVEEVAGGPPHRGTYHWEPGPEHVIRLAPRQPAVRDRPR
jgi:cytochrome P450